MVEVLKASTARVSTTPSPTYFDRHRIQPLQIAEWLRLIEFDRLDDPEEPVQ